MMDREILSSFLEFYDAEKNWLSRIFDDSPLIKALKAYAKISQPFDTLELLNIIFVAHPNELQYCKFNSLSKKQFLLVKIIYKTSPCHKAINYKTANHITNTLILLAKNNAFNLDIALYLIDQPHHHAHISNGTLQLHRSHILNIDNFKLLSTALDTNLAEHTLNIIATMYQYHLLTQEKLDRVLSNHALLSHMITMLNSNNLNNKKNFKLLVQHYDYDRLNEVIHILFCARQLIQKTFELSAAHPNIGALADAITKLYNEEPSDNTTTISNDNHSYIVPTNPMFVIPMTLNSIFKENDPRRLAYAYIIAITTDFLDTENNKLISQNPHPLFVTVMLLYNQHRLSLQDTPNWDKYINSLNHLMTKANLDNQIFTDRFVDNLVGNIDASYCYGLLIAACLDNRPVLVRSLMSYGIMPDHTSWKDRTPLTLSVTHNYVEITRILLHAGANQDCEFTEINRLLTTTMTPKQFTAEKEYTEIDALLSQTARNRYVLQIISLAAGLFKAGFLGHQIDTISFAHMLTPFLPIPANCTLNQAQHVTAKCFERVVCFFQPKKPKQAEVKKTSNRLAPLSHSL